MKKTLLSIIIILNVLVATAQLTGLSLSTSKATISTRQNVQITTTSSQVGYTYSLRDNSNHTIVHGSVSGTGNNPIIPKS